jgi:DNA-binding beta-propeller fold protein YncE
MELRTAGALLAAVLLLGIRTAPAAAQSQKKTQQQTVDPSSLVWPGPPEQPRIKFVAAIGGAEDVKGKTKLSFVERLAGRSPARDQTRLKRPYGVAVDNTGRIFVADAVQRAVLVFSRENKQASQWRGSGQFPLSQPVGVAFDDQARLFVSDSYQGLVVVFSPQGTPVAAFGKGVLARPGGMAVDITRHRIYVTDAKLNRVFVFDTSSFAQVRTIGAETAGTGKEFPGGVFSGVSNVAVDAEGRVYVTDTFNCRIQVFDADGAFLRSLGSQGTRPGSFIRPKGIAIDREGHLYVADAAFNNFQVLNPDGKPLMFVGAAGEQPGQFVLPTGMAIDSQDRIYVTEQGLDGGRLQIFQYLAQTQAPRSAGGGIR